MLNREIQQPLERRNFDAPTDKADPYRIVLVVILWILASFLAASALFILGIYWLRDL